MYEPPDMNSTNGVTSAYEGERTMCIRHLDNEYSVEPPCHNGMADLCNKYVSPSSGEKDAPEIAQAGPLAPALRFSPFPPLSPTPRSAPPPFPGAMPGWGSSQVVGYVYDNYPGNPNMHSTDPAHITDHRPCSDGLDGKHMSCGHNFAISSG